MPIHLPTVPIQCESLINIAVCQKRHGLGDDSDRYNDAIVLIWNCHTSHYYNLPITFLYEPQFPILSNSLDFNHAIIHLLKVQHFYDHCRRQYSFVGCITTRVSDILYP